MRKRYLTGNVRAEGQTSLAFLCSLDWSEDHGYIGHHVWIPLSVIHEEDHDKIEEAVEGELIEISVAEWWLTKNL